MILKYFTFKFYKMPLIIDKHTIYYDYRLFKLKVCDIKFDKDSALYNVKGKTKRCFCYVFKHVYTHSKLLEIISIMLSISFIVQVMIQYFDMKNMIYVNIFNILILFYINHVYCGKTCFIDSSYRERGHFVNPTITYKLIDKKDNMYGLQILYNGLPYIDYYMKSIDSLKKELDEYMIPDISKIIIRKMIFKN